MSVICSACHTENRDSAMFCHGCAGKLPAFVATGPSVLDGMGPARPSASGRASGSARGARASASTPFERLDVWIRIGSLALVVMCIFLGWYAYVTRQVKQPARPPVAAVEGGSAVPEVAAAELRRPAPTSSSSAQAAVMAPTATPVAPFAATPNAPAARVASLTPSTPQQIVEEAPDAKDPTPAVPLPSRPASNTRREGLARNNAPVRIVAAADPRNGCGKLNFIFAAHCEAVHCDEQAYAAHPRCNAVRAERKRDEARRNPSLGEQGF